MIILFFYVREAIRVISIHFIRRLVIKSFDPWPLSDVVNLEFFMNASIVMYLNKC